MFQHGSSIKEVYSFVEKDIDWIKAGLKYIAVHNREALRARWAELFCRSKMLSVMVLAFGLVEARSLLS